jgi:WD40 repeat protein
LSQPPSAPPGPEVDRDNPWPGLSSFTEDLKGFFFGREKETEELVRLVRRNTLTVLFGQSGLGKSSLLQAGVFPVLREADFLPLYLRLDHDPSLPPLADQVKAALIEAFKSAGADAPAPRPDESLWEYFHRKDIDIWSSKNRLLTPVLAFDQFEEIFTLGRADDARRERGRAFLTELADLVENRPPAALRAKFDSGDLDPARYAFDKPSCQVILSLREDFLPDLEGLKNEMRSLMHSRMRVRRLTGTQALEIVTRPAPHLLAEGVAERVVEFVAGGRGGSAERLAEMEVEPALLSVICRELNQRRRALGREQITADLVSGNRREILNDFYERSVSDLPPAMREFVEDHLLTKSGFRDNLALETVLEAPGVNRALVDTLVSRRLLRIEDRLGVQRVELTHDVLADVIRASRDSRQQRLALEQARLQERRARRRVWWLRGIAAGLVVLLAGVSDLAYRAVVARDRGAVRAALSDLDFASQLMERDDAPAAIAHLVNAAQTDPANPVVGTRLISALAMRSWPIWRDTGVRLPSPGVATEFLPDGKGLLILGEDGVVRLLDAKTYQLVREFHFPAQATGLQVSRLGTDMFAVVFPDGSGAVANAATGSSSEFPKPQDAAQWQKFAISPDGKWLALADKARLELVATADGRVRTSVPMPKGANPSSANFSPDSGRLMVSDWQLGVEIFRVPTLGVVLPWVHPSEYGNGGAAYADFSPDGTSCVMSWWNGARLVNAATGARVGPPLGLGTGQIEFATFDADGRRVFTMGNDREVRIWDTATQLPALPPMVHGAAVKGGQLGGLGRVLLTRSNDDVLHLWDTSTGAQLVEPNLRVRTDASAALEPGGDRVLFCAPDGRLLALRTTPSSIRPVVWMPEGDPIKVGNGGATNNTVTWFSAAEPETLLHVGRDYSEHFSLESLRTVAMARVSWKGKLRIHDSDEKTGLFLATSPDVGFSLWRNVSGTLEKVRDLADSPRHAEGSFIGESGSGLIGLATVQAAVASSIRIWRAADGLPAGPVISLPSGMQEGAISISPDGTRLALGAGNGIAGVWEIATGREVAQFIPDIPATTAATAFSPDGRLVGTTTYSDGPWIDGVAYTTGRLWNAQTGQPVGPPHRHRENMMVALSPDSQLAVFASVDGSMDVVSTLTGQSIYAPLIFPYSPLSGDSLFKAARFLGSDRIVMGTREAILCWDAHSGLPLMEPLRPSGEPISLYDIDSKGRFAALIAFSGRVSIWPLPPHYGRAEVPQWLLRLARTLSGRRLDENGALVPSDTDFERTNAGLATVREELAALPADAPYAEWGRWILADPDTRTIAPGLNITLAEARARGLSGD